MTATRVTPSFVLAARFCDCVAASQEFVVRGDSGRSTNSSNRQSELQWPAIDRRRRKRPIGRRVGALLVRSERAGRCGRGWEETTRLWRRINDSSRPYGLHAIQRSLVTATAAQNIENHTARATEQ